MVKYQPFCYKLVDHEIKKKISSFNMIRLHLQEKIILEMFMAAPTEYFTVKSEQEMDLASVIAMNFMKVLFIFLRLEQRSRPLESQNPPLVTLASIVPIWQQTVPKLERCSRRGKNFFQGGRLQYLPLFSTIVALGLGGAAPCPPFIVAALAKNRFRNLNILTS